MLYRRFGRTGWQVSEMGYGMWGMAGWTGSEDTESLASLNRAVELGCNFFDTAFAYGEGHSETLLGKLVRANPDTKLYTASKIPPKNRRWPALPSYPLEDVYPADYIIEMTDSSLKNLGLEQLDLMQFHVWDDTWADDPRWQEAVNTLNQNPEDELFPVADELDIAIIARVPFDEGSLIGNMTADTRFPEGDWRNSYFVPENLIPTLERVERLRPLVPPDMTMAEMALRFILENKTVSTIIPGMRKLANVEANIAASDGAGLPDGLLEALREHRWVRTPTKWSQ
jgi:aryl-alcohol dehydrogenase-like predicted oxidoreductase